MLAILMTDRQSSFILQFGPQSTSHRADYTAWWPAHNHMIDSYRSVGAFRSPSVVHLSQSQPFGINVSILRCIAALAMTVCHYFAVTKKTCKTLTLTTPKHFAISSCMPDNEKHTREILWTHVYSYMYFFPSTSDRMTCRRARSTWVVVIALCLQAMDPLCYGIGRYGILS